MLSSEDLFSDGEDDEDVLGVEFVDGPSRTRQCTTACTRKSVCHI